MLLRHITMLVLVGMIAACSSAPAGDSGKLNDNDNRSSFIGTQGSNIFTQHLWWL